MAYYRTEKIARGHVAIFDAATGEHVTTLRTREAASWLHRMEKSRADDEVYAREARERRLSNARAYLAARATRPVQLSFW